MLQLSRRIRNVVFHHAIGSPCLSRGASASMSSATATTTAGREVGLGPSDTLQDSAAVITKCQSLRDSIQVINDRYKGPLHKGTTQNTILPFVFLLGNHSSGKSSFVNYVFQRKIQSSGVAPTDDSFTIIVPGPTDVDKDGPAIIGDPDMGFSSLRAFGPPLIHHTQLKIRSDTALKNMMIIDSPGMIDSPMVSDAYRGSKAVMQRGYDFEGVCKWYAERADVILLFFDPDKPGTTGETLQVLTSALTGLEHKLHIVLNKADQFKQIHDFARAYGSLCWNLSKVIHRKDLPRIYTMCLPPAYRSKGSVDHTAETDSLGQGLADLESTREDVVREVFNAPKRRVDNEITRVADSIALLQIYCSVLDDIIGQYKSKLILARIGLLATTAACAGGATAAIFMEIPPMIVAQASIAAPVLIAGLYMYLTRYLTDTATALASPEEMDKSFRRIFSRQLVDKDEYYISLWSRVADHLKLFITADDVQKLERQRHADKNLLRTIAEVELPLLRRIAAPAMYSSYSLR
jgi:Dynamin family